MASKEKEERTKYFDRQKFEADSEGFLDMMWANLHELLNSGIAQGKKGMENLYLCYKQYYLDKCTLTQEQQNYFSSQVSAIKGISSALYIDVIYLPSKKLQLAILNSVQADIDKGMYEIFAQKKKYFECLEALQDKMVDEQEFDLRIFDKFTGLKWASSYQQVPVISVNSITFNNMNLNNEIKNENKRKEVLISETITEIDLPLKQVDESHKQEKQYRDNQKCFQVIKPLSIQENQLYFISGDNKEKDQILYFKRRASNVSDDFPFETQFQCRIY